MDTYITFQYKPEGKRPDDITLTDVHTLLTAGSVVPGVGDIVTIQLASTIREFKVSEREASGRFKSSGVTSLTTRKMGEEARSSSVATST